MSQTLKKQGLFHTAKKNKDGKETLDLCPVCDVNLWHDEKYTKRCAIVDEETDELCGWVCPFCTTEFDNDSNIVDLYAGEHKGIA